MFTYPITFFQEGGVVAQAEINRTDGTAFTDMNDQGAASTCFAGDAGTTFVGGNSQTQYMIGKDWGVSVTHKVTGVECHGRQASDGFWAGTPTVTLTLYGGSSAPSTPTDGTSLGTIFSTTDPDDTNFYGSIDPANYTTTTAYRYHWVRISSGAANDGYMGEVRFYEFGI